MPRVHNVKELARTDRGDFVRYLGKRTQADRRTDAKFYLDRDERLAVANRARLERLWTRILEDDLSGEHPVWDTVGYEVGKAIAAGALEYRLPRELVLTSPEYLEDTYTFAVGRYARLCDGIIRVVPADEPTYAAGLGVILREREEAIRTRIAPGWPAPAEFPAPAVPLGRPHETLHHALDAFTATLQKDGEGNPASLGPKLRQVQTLRERHADVPLGRLGKDAIRDVARFWMDRPKVKDRDRPVAPITARKMWERFVSFLRWLHRSDDYAWRMPEDILDEIRFRPRLNAEENAARARALHVSVWTPEQLAVLYREATPPMRLMILLGLNCGFQTADIGTVEDGMVALDRLHPHADALDFPSTAADSWMFTIRNKTQVYGEFLLWPHTVRGIRWALRRKKGLALKSNLVLPTRDGTSFSAPTEKGDKSSRIPNMWPTVRSCLGWLSGMVAVRSLAG